MASSLLPGVLVRVTGRGAPGAGEICGEGLVADQAETDISIDTKCGRCHIVL
jgi:hypothetical protein